MNDQWNAVCDVISSDAKENWDRIQTEDSMLNRRNYVRSVFTLYEASLANLRERVGSMLISKFESSGEWEVHRFIPLLDELPQVSRNGKIKKEPNKASFLALVAYVLKTYAELISYDVEILGDNGWELFCKSVNIRNRITHPKRKNEFEITDDDLKIVEGSRLWWNGILEKLWDVHEKSLNKCIKTDFTRRRNAG